MTTQEFNDQFDILYNNITSNQAPGLDEYEKSVFLTIAQDDIIKGYFNPKGNKFIEGYGDNPKRDIDFSRLIKVQKYISTQDVEIEDTNIKPLGEAQFDTHYNSKGAVFPTDILFVISEQIMVKRGNSNITLQVVPLNYMEYSRIMSRPYKRPLVNQAWRISNDYDKEHKVDLVVGASDSIDQYIIRYVKRPSKIDITIDSENPCELDEELHLEILKRAVELAKASYIGDLSSTISLGQVSGSNLGVVSQQNNNREQ